MNKPVEAQAATVTGAEAVVEMLRLHGVEIVFGLCGDTSLPFYDALARLPHGMRHVLTRDERHAAYMADGYARVSGRVSTWRMPCGRRASASYSGRLVSPHRPKITSTPCAFSISTTASAPVTLPTCGSTRLFTQVL